MLSSTASAADAARRRQPARVAASLLTTIYHMLKDAPNFRISAPTISIAAPRK
jgi:hypothetical protein